jgi:hypothetical protein
MKVSAPYSIYFPGHNYVVDEESRIYDPEKCDFISVDNLIAKGANQDDEYLYPSIRPVKEFKKDWKIETQMGVIPVDLLTLLMLESIAKYVTLLTPKVNSRIIDVRKIFPVDSNDVTAFHKTTRKRTKIVNYDAKFPSIQVFVEYLNNVNLYGKEYTDVINKHSKNYEPKTTKNPMYSFLCDAVKKYKVGEATSPEEKIDLLSCYGNKNPNFVESKRQLSIEAFSDYAPYWAEMLYIRGRQKIVAQRELSGNEWKVVQNWRDYKSLSEILRISAELARFDDIMIDTHDSFMEQNPVSTWFLKKPTSEKTEKTEKSTKSS